MAVKWRGKVAVKTRKQTSQQERGQAGEGKCENKKERARKGK